MITSHWFVTRPMPLYWGGWVTPLQQWWWKFWYQKMLFEGSCSLSDDSLSTSKGIFADLIHLIIPSLVASPSFWCKCPAFSNTLWLLKGDIVYYEGAGKEEQQEVESGWSREPVSCTACPHCTSSLFGLRLLPHLLKLFLPPAPKQQSTARALLAVVEGQHCFLISSSCWSIQKETRDSPLEASASVNLLQRIVVARD